jgi:hypothetical protein
MLRNTSRNKLHVSFPHEKLAVNLLVKIFTALHVTRILIAVFKIARHWSLNVTPSVAKIVFFFQASDEILQAFLESTYATYPDHLSLSLSEHSLLATTTMCRTCS